MNRFNKSLIQNLIPGLCTLSILLTGCGEAPENTGSEVREDPLYQAATGGLHLSPMSPLYIAFDRSLDDPKRIVSVMRERPLYQFEELIQPVLAQYSSAVKSLVTGLGIRAVDRNGRPMKLTLALKVRRFDSSTSSFTRETKLIAGAHTSFAGAQDYLIRNEENPNIVMTGLGLRLREGNITGLFLQRKELGAINGASASTPGDDDMTYLQAEPGWAVVGFYFKAKVDVAQYDMNKSKDRKLYESHPTSFLEDTLFYTGQLAD